MPFQLRVDGREVEVADDGASLLEVLRDRLGIRSAKDGCSPQGQCGCCTVLIDGQPRVACVTPARRAAGRSVTTLDGMPGEVRDTWAAAFTASGASQCGFCTPGIIVRLAAIAAGRPAGVGLTDDEVERALAAHLCRCTGWRTIVEAAKSVGAAGVGWAAGSSGATPVPGSLGSGAPAGAMAARDLVAAGRRASLEGRTPQRVGSDVAVGAAGFADDTAPANALIAVPDASGGWVVGETLTEARLAAGKVQGRRTTIELQHPIALPDGEWALALRTTWVEPAYLEPDASWCQPGGEPASPLANGGAFGGKLASVAPSVARELADRHGRTVRVVLAREDVVRLGPKRPPMAAGVRHDGTGVVRIARTAGIVAAIQSVAPGLVVDEVDVPGPPTSVLVRAAGWAEAAVLLAGLRSRASLAASRREPRLAYASVVSPEGAVASATVQADGSIAVVVACGPVLDEVVLRSYVVGATHQALSWVTREGLAVDSAGVPHDLTIRSFGILRASETPRITVRILAPDDPVPEGWIPSKEPVNGSDAAFAAVAAAVWIERGLATDWPTDRRSRT